MGLSLPCTFVLLCLGLASASYQRLEWSDCGSDPSVSISTIEVTPMPIVLPGPMQLTIEGQSSRAIGDIDIKIGVKRATFLLDLPIPCVFHIGSCTYESSCTGTGLLDRMISENWAGVLGGVGTQIKAMLGTVPGLSNGTCPVPATSINVQKYSLNLPGVPSVLSFFASGDYKAHVTAVEKSTGHTLVCLQVGVTVHES